MIAFDTLEFVKELESAGFPPGQAEAQTRLIVRLLHRLEEARLEDLATKRDVDALDDKLEVRIAEIKRDIKELDVKLSRDIKELDVKLSRDIKELDVKLSRDIKEMNAKIESTKNELEAKIEATKADLQRDIAESKTEIIKWVVGLAMAQMAMMAGIFMALFRLFPMTH